MFDEKTSFRFYGRAAFLQGEIGESKARINFGLVLNLVVTSNLRPSAEQLIVSPIHNPHEVIRFIPDVAE